MFFLRQELDAIEERAKLNRPRNNVWWATPNKGTGATCFFLCV